MKNKDKKLPAIVISGPSKKLIEIETILAHYYDVPDENWNNYMAEEITNDSTDFNHLVLYNTGEIEYHNHPANEFKTDARFNYKQLNEILTFIENFK